MVMLCCMRRSLLSSLPSFPSPGGHCRLSLLLRGFGSRAGSLKVDDSLLAHPTGGSRDMIEAMREKQALSLHEQINRHRLHGKDFNEPPILM